MMRGVALAVAASIFLFGRAAFAHRIDEYLQATILSVESNRVDASMRLIPGVLVSPLVIAEIDSNGDGVFSDAEEKAYAQRVLDDLSITMDGQRVKPRLVSWRFPQPGQMRDGLGEIHIEYIVEIPPGDGERRLILANHHLEGRSVYLVNAVEPEDRNLRITAQRRNTRQTVYELDYQQMGAVASGTFWTGLQVRLGSVQFSELFHLGMRHIAEGTDHLLFLLTLLLPAPLLVLGRRWGPPVDVRSSLLRVLGIVTAFTVGHSITLTLAAMGAFHVPSRPVEVLIAVSIFVSAVHALLPIAAGKETLIAGFFGLIHGLAFAATLDRLGFGRWERVAGILSFNLGIEAMQMLVVAAILPSLMLMSRTRAYPLLRIGGAILAGAASVGWIVQRLFGVETPIDAIVNTFAHHAVWIAIALFAVSVLCRFVLSSSARRTVQTDMQSGVSVPARVSGALDR